jgi:hypothetical protein
VEAGAIDSQVADSVFCFPVSLCSLSRLSADCALLVGSALFHMLF